jgi:hypothetical protein
MNWSKMSGADAPDAISASTAALSFDLLDIIHLAQLFDGLL